MDCRKDASGRPVRRPWWFILAAPAALLWIFIAYLGLIELNDLVRGSETEHSPLLVIAILLPPAGLLTWTASTARRR